MIGGLQGEFGDLDIKYLKQNISKMSVANIGKLQENFAVTQEGCEISQHEGHHFAAKGWFRSPPLVISQPKADFAALRNWPSALSDRLLMVVTLSFELWIMHRLKHWIANFPSFEMTYSMHNLGSRKCSKSGWQWLSSRMLHVRFLFASPPCIPDLLMAKDFKASVLHVSELSIALPWIPKNSPQSRIALVIKKLSKHQNLTQFD